MNHRQYSLTSQPRIEEVVSASNAAGESKTIFGVADIPKQCRSKKCSCGSGKPKSPQYDACSIFLTHTCEDCHDRKMAEFRPDILTDPDYWTDEPIDDD